jgi:DNA-binding CsgD family transcriptional regulator
MIIHFEMKILSFYMCVNFNKPEIQFKGTKYTVEMFYVSDLGFLMMRLFNPLIKTYHNHILQLHNENENIFIDILNTSSNRSNDKSIDINALFNERLNSIVEIEKTFPQLTVKERKLCAFLVVDKSTAEISKATGQSIHTLTVARYRIRKKIGIPKSAELNAYLREQLDLI